MDATGIHLKKTHFGFTVCESSEAPIHLLAADLPTDPIKASKVAPPQ
jgi:hypothetical protein